LSLCGFFLLDDSGLLSGFFLFLLLDDSGLLSGFFFFFSLDDSGLLSGFFFFFSLDDSGLLSGFFFFFSLWVFLCFLASEQPGQSSAAHLSEEAYAASAGPGARS
jgi:hypothetical protein